MKLTFLKQKSAFTLVELLVVISIIGILAGLMLTVLPLASDKAKRSRVKAQLQQIETAISRYQAKHGVVPPDNTSGNPNINQLYYELSGAVWDGTKYTDFSGVDTILPSTLMAMFGVGGIVNASKTGERPLNFFNQDVPTVDIGGAKMVKVPVDWPDNYPNPPVPAKPTVNVWRYNSSSPIHNKNSYDLWAVIVLRNKEITISNWDRQ